MYKLSVVRYPFLQVIEMVKLEANGMCGAYKWKMAVRKRAECCRFLILIIHHTYLILKRFFHYQLLILSCCFFKNNGANHLAEEVFLCLPSIKFIDRVWPIH